MLSKTPGGGSAWVTDRLWTQLPSALEAAQGRMKKKVLGAEEALQGGVGKVIIADGRIQNPISSAINGNGTVIQ